jgi:hypothetical protein
MTRLATAASGAALLALSMTTGCAGLLSFQSARPLPVGTFQVALEPSYLVTRAKTSSETQLLPAFSVRYGATRNLEVGARTGPGIRPELMAKLTLKDAPHRVAVAVATTLGAWRYNDNLSRNFRVYSQPALLVSVPIGRLSELTLAEKLDITGAGDVDTGAWALVFTEAISLGWALRPASWFGVMPEVAMGYSLLHVGTGGPVVGGGFAFQAGIGLLFGGQPR